MNPSPQRNLATAYASPPLWRRLFHLLGGSILPVAGIFLPRLLIIIIATALMLISFGLDLIRIRLPFFNRIFLRVLSPFLKKSEDRRITGATYMLIATVVAFLVFERNVAVVALLFLSVGDPMAALVGSRTPGPRIFRKSPGGTLAFVGASLLVVLVLVGSGFTNYHWGFIAGSVIAAGIELAPVPLDDNLTIPLLTGTALHFLVI